MALFGCQWYNFLIPAAWKLHVHYWTQIPQDAISVVISEIPEGNLDFSIIHEMSWPDQILISNEFKHSSKSILNAAWSVSRTLHFPPYYNGDDTCSKALDLCRFAKRAVHWCTNRDVIKWKDMCSPYGCGHGCLVSERVHLTFLQKRTCAKYFFGLIFSCYKYLSSSHLTHRFQDTSCQNILEWLVSVKDDCQEVPAYATLGEQTLNIILCVPQWLPQAVFS